MSKLKRIERIRTFLGGFLLGFWFVETIWFLILEGWHWKATSPNEIIADRIVSFMIFIWLILFIKSLDIIIEAVIRGAGNKL